MKYYFLTYPDVTKPGLEITTPQTTENVSVTPAGINNYYYCRNKCIVAAREREGEYSCSRLSMVLCMQQLSPIIGCGLCKHIKWLFIVDGGPNLH